MTRESRNIEITKAEEGYINSKVIIVCNYITRGCNPNKRTKSIKEICEGHIEQYQSLIAKLEQNNNQELRGIIEEECNKTCCGGARWRAAKKYRSHLFQ